MRVGSPPPRLESSPVPAASPVPDPVNPAAMATGPAGRTWPSAWHRPWARPPRNGGPWTACQRGGAQEWLAAGESQRRCRPLRHPVPAPPGARVSGGSPNHPVRLRAGSTGRSPDRGDHRRDRVPEAGHPFGRSGAAVLRHGGAGGELPGRGLPGLRGARGCTLLDAELYLSKGWTDDPAWRPAVGWALDTPWATKPQLAQRLLARAQTAGMALAWVVGDTVHDHSGQLRPGWRRGTRPACWRCRPTKRSGWASTSMGWGRCMRTGPRGTGSGLARSPAAKANAGTTGSAWCWPKGPTRTKATACGSGVPVRSRRSGRPISCGVPGLRHAHPGPGGRQPSAHRVGL